MKMTMDEWFAMLTGLFGLVVVIAIGALAALVVVKMMRNEIDLKYLIAEDNGDASLSRFQMLLFTFVIAAAYFIYALVGLKGPSCTVAAIAVAGDAAKDVEALRQVMAEAVKSKYCLPEVPNSVLGLIGISGGSYLLAKGLQTVSGSGGTGGETSGGAGGGAASTPASTPAGTRRPIA